MRRSRSPWPPCLSGSHRSLFSRRVTVSAKPYGDFTTTVPGCGAATSACAGTPVATEFELAMSARSFASLGLDDVNPPFLTRDRCKKLSCSAINQRGTANGLVRDDGHCPMIHAWRLALVGECPLWTLRLGAAELSASLDPAAATDAMQSAVPVIDIAAALEQHRSYLMRLACLELRDEDIAQDVVQETMLAALASKTFSGASTLRTWLTSILKHKIIDVIRKRRRLAEVPEFFAEDRSDPDQDEFDSPFDEGGGWHAKPSSWGDPEQSLHQRQFLEVMALCMEHLPANTARVFVMREYLGLEVSEISQELKITAGNTYVILYRARVALRACIEKKWLANEPSRSAERDSP